MTFPTLHPSVQLALWAIAVVGLQSLAFPLLVVATLLALSLAAIMARSRCGRLLKRTRWVFLALVVIFSLGTPGLLVMPAAGALGPTYDGVQAAAEHALRLLAIVALVAVLLERCAPARLVSGLYGLAAPLRWIAFDPKKLAVRLMLVLECVERPPRWNWRDWLDGRADGNVLPDRYLLPRHHLGWADHLALVAAASLAIVLALS